MISVTTPRFVLQASLDFLQLQLSRSHLEWNRHSSRVTVHVMHSEMLLNDAPKNYCIRRPCSDPLLTNLSILSSVVISSSSFVKQKSWIHKPLKFFTSGNPAYFWAHFERDRTGWVRHSRESVMHKTIIKSQCEFSPLFFPSKSNFIPASLKENQTINSERRHIYRKWMGALVGIHKVSTLVDTENLPFLSVLRNVQYFLH